MTLAVAAHEIGATLEEKFPGSVVEAEGDCLCITPDSVLQVMTYLKDMPGQEYDYFNFVTAVDYYQYFEVVYRLTSTVHNTSVCVKTRLPGRENLSVASVTGLWQGADFQEREIFDLLGIRFEGHYNLRRIFLWEGYDGHPLRKDFNR
jgi:NADH-quinone oxidoreductase subunit C